jgi:hypothetical protein|nr:tetratricopeptide repeat protein [Kofleriaceae bacterium]
MKLELALATLSVVAVPRIAAADPGGADDANLRAAEALFDEGRALLDAGKLNEACERFDQSLAKDPNAVGTLVNVAKCQARLGKIASAVATFTSARDHAREQHADPYMAVAQENIDKLLPFVPHLSLGFADRAADLVVTVDDHPVALAASADITLDPGPHDLVVKEPGHRPYRERFTIAKKDRLTRNIPALDGLGEFPTGLVVTAGGGALVVTGLVLGLVARSHYNDAKTNECMGDIHDCSTQGLQDTNSARSLGNVGTVIGIAGIVGAGVGGFLWWRSHDRSERDDAAIAVVPMVGSEQVGVAASGRF